MIIVTKKNKPWFLKSVGVYVAVLLLFALIGDRGLIASYRLWRTGSKLDREIEKLKVDVQNLRQTVQKFRSDDKTIEQYAREKMNLSADNEIQFIFK